MSGYVVRTGQSSYLISDREHQTRQNLVKYRLPYVLEKIKQNNRTFPGRPPFVVENKGAQVRVFREDYYRQLTETADVAHLSPWTRLSLSEWALDIAYRGEESYVSRPITLHDVFAAPGLTVKTGNPYCNNAWEEFYNALYARSIGLVEGKSPLGFVFDREDIYGEQRPGLMFYKHLKGVDLAEAVSQGEHQLLNWALWEAGKFYSRLIAANLYLADANRLGNYFIEDGGVTKVFRFLDLEKLYPQRPMRSEPTVKMLLDFIASAYQKGLITPERIAEFTIVCLGKDQEKINTLQKMIQGKLGITL